MIETLHGLRPRTMSLAYRMLGSVAENSSFPIGMIDETDYDRNVVQSWDRSIRVQRSSNAQVVGTWRLNGDQRR